jgi:phenylalanyl-tRNA synthetase beta chain
MNVSFNWLRELVPGLEGSAEEVAERFSLAAAAVETLEQVGHGVADIVVARVMEAEPHPNADRLTFCRIDRGADEPVELVCGAPVVEVGALYPYVAPGVELPGGFRIESRKIRGVMSHGMLCSEFELELGRDKSGIMRLPDGLDPGQSLTEALGLPDMRLTLDLNPNRVDLACHVGVARELTPHGGADLTLRDPGVRWPPRWNDGTESASAAGFTVRIEAADRCPRYLGAIVREVKVGPSPAWLAGRLLAIGARPINNVVDATNYVLFELNQPIHAFDLSTLRGSEIRVRAAQRGERLRTLDGENRDLGPDVTVIADLDRAVALAGVMGGEDTEVAPDTVDLFIECAAFAPMAVRNTGRALTLPT